MTFQDHLAKFRDSAGNYDLAATEHARIAELMQSPDAIAKMAEKVAKQERAAWLRTETGHLHKLFQQPALSPELELDVKVPLGESVVREYGCMDMQAIQIRKDLRTQIHLDEADAYTIEMRHWFDTQKLLLPGETIAGAQLRLDDGP